VLPIASVDAFASKERGHNPDDNEAVGAAAFGMRQVAASAGGGPAAGTRRLADGVFVLALSGNNNAVAASEGQLDGYTRRHKSVEAAGAAFGACQGVAVAWNGPATGTKLPVVDRLTHVANQKAPALSARRPDGSVTDGERKVAARPGTHIESDDEAGVKQTVKGSYPKRADGKARDPQAEA
jgi:hypothetical protein